MYRVLGNLPWLRRSFKAKVLLVAFLGTHVPLLAILTFFIYNNVVTQVYALQVLAMALGATLIGTLATLLALHGLLRPIDLTLEMLGQFRDKRRLIQPQVTLHDEMGTLIEGTAQTLTNLEAHLEHVTTHDKVTGALNTAGLEHAVSAARRASPQAVALIHMRVRNFTQIEAGFSRDEVDFAIRTIVNRLRLTFPAPSRIAVSGHGRFAVLITDNDAAPSLEERLSRGLPRLADPFRIGTVQVTPICALGAAAVATLTSLNDLFSAVADALLTAEERDGSNWAIASEIDGEPRTHADLALELDRAIHTAQVFLVYQPRVDIRSGQIKSVEALARWNHPKRGIITPDLFIPMAERTGKILELGRCVLDQAVGQAAAWERAGRRVSVSVNVAAVQISKATLVDDVRASLARHGLSPHRLELEITETALLQRTAENVDIVKRIRDLGVAVALDDFGTGYSSLSHLGRLPADRVKIDRSFVSRLNKPRDRQIVEGLVSLCRALGLAVTAEGVETEAQAETLRAIGCDEWQGFFFAAPSAADEIDWHPRIPAPTQR